MKFNYNWQEALWKIVTNPLIEVIAAVVVMLVAAWFVVDTAVVQKGAQPFPIPYGGK